MQRKDKITMSNKLLFEQVLDYIGLGKDVTIRIKGNSMRPFLKEDDTVILKPFKLKELKKGLIVLAQLNGQMVLHRVVKYDNAKIWLAGDNNLVARELVSCADVVATVTSVNRSKTAVKLTQRWRRYLGQAWYLIRPFRRVIRKLC